MAPDSNVNIQVNTSSTHWDVLESGSRHKQGPITGNQTSALSKNLQFIPTTDPVGEWWWWWGGFSRF